MRVTRVLPPLPGGVCVKIFCMEYNFEWPNRDVNIEITGRNKVCRASQVKVVFDIIN